MARGPSKQAHPVSAPEEERMEQIAIAQELAAGDPKELAWLYTAQDALVAMGAYASLHPAARMQHQLALRSVQATIAYNERREDIHHRTLVEANRALLTAVTA